MKTSPISKVLQMVIVNKQHAMPSLMHLYLFYLSTFLKDLNKVPNCLMLKPNTKFDFGNTFKVHVELKRVDVCLSFSKVTS